MSQSGTSETLPATASFRVSRRGAIATIASATAATALGMSSRQAIAAAAPATQNAATGPNASIFTSDQRTNFSPIISGGSATVTISPNGSATTVMFDDLTAQVSAPQADVIGGTTTRSVLRGGSAERIIHRILHIGLPLNKHRDANVKGVAPNVRGIVSKDAECRAVISIDVGGTTKQWVFGYGEPAEVTINEILSTAALPPAERAPYTSYLNLTIMLMVERLALSGNCLAAIESIDLTIPG